jgi:hypothetical protein
MADMDREVLKRLKQTLNANQNYEEAGMETEDVLEPDEKEAFRQIANSPQGALFLKGLGKLLNFSGVITDMRYAISHNIFLNILDICGWTQDDILSFIVKELR